MFIRSMLFLLIAFLIPQNAEAVTPTSPLPKELGVILTDPSGNGVEGTLFGQLKVAETHRRAGGVFNDSALDPTIGTSIRACISSLKAPPPTFR